MSNSPGPAKTFVFGPGSRKRCLQAAPVEHSRNTNTCAPPGLRKLWLGGIATKNCSEQFLNSVMHGVTMRCLALLSSPKLSTTLFTTFILSLLILSNQSFAAAPDRIAGPIDSRQTFAMPRSLHPQARPQYDRGPVEPSREFGYLTMVTAPSASQQKALDQLLAEQQDRTSP